MVTDVARGGQRVLGGMFYGVFGGLGGHACSFFKVSKT
jgi:hypothetical protein